MRLSPVLPIVLLGVASVCAGEWPQWRGPNRNGIAEGSPKLIDRFPEGGVKAAWESEIIPSNDEGGLSSPIIAKRRVYVSVVWHRDVPSETRQIDELVLRQLGYQSVQPLGPELVAKMEAARESIGPQLRGKKLDEFIDQWVTTNLDKKQQQLYRGFVDKRFKRGKLAMPLDVLESLNKHKDHVFANAAEMETWLKAQGWSEPVTQEITAAVPPTKRVADDVIVCLELDSGKTLWKCVTPGEPTGRTASSTPCYVEGKVYALGSTNALCIEAETGKLLWSVPLTSKGPGSSPVVAEGLMIINLKHLVAIDTATGKERWKQPKAGGGFSSPVVWKGGDRTIVISNGRSEIHGVDLQSGEVLWSVPGGGDSTPAIADNGLVVQTKKPELGLVCYRLDSSVPERIWNKPMDALRTQSSPLVYEDAVYLMDDDVHYCFDRSTGEQRWRETVPSTIASPLLADGKILVMLNNGNNLGMIKAEAGARTEIGKTNIRAQWVPSPAISDGMVVVRAKDRLKCFDLGAE